MKNTESMRMGGSRKNEGGRWLAYQALEAWEQRGLATEAAIEEACRGADPRERALALELTLGVLRWKGRLDDLLGRLLSRPLSKLHPAVRNVLRVGLYQLRSVSRIPARAVVHESVEMTRLAGIPWASGLINGVLRRYDREREALEAHPEGRDVEALATRWSHTPWLVRQLQAVAGAELEPWLEANNTVPPLTLRVNPARLSRDELVERLTGAGLTVRPTQYSPWGVVVESGGAVTAIPGYAEGWFAVQDEASQLVARVVGARAGESVLDACAAPGGKTVHLAALVGETGQVFATDASRDRLGHIAETVARLGGERVQLSVFDWTRQPGEADLPALPPRVDRALVDAPCSGFGVVWRKPEIKWRRKPEEVSRYPARQTTILETVATRVKPGGTLVYSVCTPLLAEGPRVVEAFLASHPEFRLVDLHSELEPSLHPLLTREGYLRTTPHKHRCDAFFAARLERASGS